MKSVAMQEQVKYCMSLFRNMTQKYRKRAKNSQKTALHETLKTNNTLLKVQSQDFFGDSEAHAYEISTYAVKRRRFYVLECKCAQ